MGKFNTARWVEAPCKMSEGTSISPMESRSVLVVMGRIVPVGEVLHEANHRTRMLGAEQIMSSVRQGHKGPIFLGRQMLNTLDWGNLVPRPVHHPNGTSGGNLVQGPRKTLPALKPPTHRLHKDARWETFLTKLASQGLREVSCSESHGAINTLGLGGKTQPDRKAACRKGM